MHNSELNILASQFAREPPLLHHERRLVQGIHLAGWELGRREVDEWHANGGGIALVLNPPSSLRAASPVLVGGVRDGSVQWVLPLDHERVVLGPRPTDALAAMMKEMFAQFWDEVFAASRSLTHSQPLEIHDPGVRFGNLGVETGAKGHAVHPLVPLVRLERGVELWFPLSAQQHGGQRFVEAYPEADVIDLQSHSPLKQKRGAIEGKAGQVEFAHLAAFRSLPTASHNVGLSAAAAISATRKLRFDWAQDRRGDHITGKDLWSCDPAVGPGRLCDGCRSQSRLAGAEVRSVSGGRAISGPAEPGR